MPAHLRPLLSRLVVVVADVYAGADNTASCVIFDMRSVNLCGDQESEWMMS